tara:strand:- start:56 stop:313 length:258 start_codon:yes stop_codon:yes gene_type:complete
MDQEVLVVSSKEELKKFGYLYTNVNKEVVYEGLSFLLKQCGIKQSFKPMVPIIPFMGYSQPFIMPRQPQWEIKLNELTVTVTNII